MTTKLKYAPLVLSALLSTQQRAQAQEDSQPNFLFICIDDLRPQIGAYGYEQIKSPNLDKIAEQGRLFTQQYVQVSTSGASRACMLTGRAPRKQEDMNNEIFGLSLVGTKEGEIPETFIHHLKRNGYYTVGMGKVSHHGNGSTIYNGNESRELPHSWDRYVNDPDWLWKRDDILHAYADGGARTDSPKPAFDAPNVADESLPDGRLANLATTELELIAKRGEPFFMAVGFYKPHLPFCAPLKYWELYDDEDIELSPIRTIPEGVDKTFIYSSLEFFNQYSHPERGGVGIVLSDDYSRDVIHGYYAAISYTDTQVGKVMAKLEELGLDDNTIVVVWGDHGWHLGDHTVWGKHTSFSRAFNSTFMVRTPDMKSPGVKSDNLVAAIDIYPTICELAGITPPDNIDGESIVPILDNPKAKVRDEVVSYWHNQISVKTDRYRMSIYNNDKNGKRAVMLFDNKNDPYETVNIAEENPKIVAQLTERLQDNNRGFITNFSSPLEW